MMQVHRPHKTISTDRCAMHCVCSESALNLLSNWSASVSIYQPVFGVFSQHWVCPRIMDLFHRYVERLRNYYINLLFCKCLMFLFFCFSGFRILLTLCNSFFSSQWIFSFIQRTHLYKNHSSCRAKITNQILQQKKKTNQSVTRYEL